MGLKFKKTPSHSKETLRIVKSKGVATGKVNVVMYRDRDTRQIVMYIPSFEITGYGATEAKAKMMLKFCLDEFLLSLIRMPIDKRERELRSLGWDKGKYSTKEFSKAYIDANGKLQNLNAVADKVEEAVLAY